MVLVTFTGISTNSSADHQVSSTVYSKCMKIKLESGMHSYLVLLVTICYVATVHSNSRGEFSCKLNTGGIMMNSYC